MHKKNIKKPLIIIAGATASGKSSLALDLLYKKIDNKYIKEKINGKEIFITENNFKIISADSRQIYKNIPIFSGTTKKEIDNISLISFLEEDKKFSAGDFQKLAKREMDIAWNNNSIPIVVGGTSFYLQSILYENFLPKVDIDNELRKELEPKTISELLGQLKNIDPERAKTIDKFNKPRIIRAIEIVKKLGKVPPLEYNIKKHLDVTFIWIKIDREKQRKKIEDNFQKRINDGFPEEASSLKETLENKNISDEEITDIFFNLGLAYKHIFKYWNREISKKDFIELGVLEEYKYAKRQNTYLKKFFNNLPTSVRKIIIEK